VKVRYDRPMPAAWSDCAICRDLPDRGSVELSIGQPTGDIPAGYARLFAAAAGADTLRCPECGTTYHQTEKYDPDHYMGMGTRFIERVKP